MIKSSLSFLKLTIAMLLPVILSGNASAQKRYQKMAMYIAAKSVDDIQPPQERAAAKLFKERFSEFGTILTPEDVDKIKYPDFDCLWIHIDSIGKSQGVEKFRGAFISPKFLDAVRKFHEDGGNLYMSKFAIELLYSDGLGCLADYLRPNVFSSGEGGENPDIWAVNAQIGAIRQGDDPLGQYADRRNHPIYAGLTDMASTEWAAVPDPIYDNNPYRVFPMQGNASHAAIHREDHNCMWRLAMKTDENATIGIYVSEPGVHSFADIDKIENPQERAAADFMLNPEGFIKRVRPTVNVEIIGPENIDLIEDYNHFDCLWIHIDRCGLQQGWENLPEGFRSERLIAALKQYSENGGQLLLTKQATQLVVPIGRVDAEYAPNLFGSGDGGDGTDVWHINAHIGWNWHDEATGYYDRTGHDIFADLISADSPYAYSSFPIEGTADGSAMWREDHNCLWDLNNLAPYKGRPINKITAFQEDCNARILGTWGQVADDAVAGIVEFRPTIRYRGRIIANGLAACEWAPRNGGNAWHSQLEQLTFNCLRYLVTVTDFKFISDGPDGVARFEQDANATVLGTWGQDWNHQAAGIVEFHPASSAVAYASEPSLDELNRNKAPRGTIIANGLGCVQLYHDRTPGNDYQANTDRLTANIIDYLSPWHERTVSGVEDVGTTPQGAVRALAGEIGYEGFPSPTLIEVYRLDGRLIEARTVSGEGSFPVDVSGTVIVSAAGTVTKLIL